MQVLAARFEVRLHSQAVATLEIRVSARNLLRVEVVRVYLSTVSATGRGLVLAALRNVLRVSYILLIVQIL